ncbi:MAG: hypothetical protein K8R36_06485 [Planctomycetales bacterium]|nr:hypothetical protein [Planctomycetales bacterium]
MVKNRIFAILADDHLDDESSPISKTDAIEALIGEYGWTPIRECMLDVLRDNSLEPHWRTAVHVFWGAVLDRRELPADELLAWLYHRFGSDGRDEDNEVWSIASKLKGVSYLSEYDPLKDAAILAYLKAIQSQTPPVHKSDKPD